MLNFPYFSHNLLKKYTVLFGSLFSNINIARKDRQTGEELSYFKVPITYAAKDKMLVRLMQDPTIQKPSAIDLPLMSFEYNVVGYDKERVLNRNLTIIGPPSGNSAMSTTLTPVPYDIAFQLYAYVKFEEDGQKIVEQVVPFFQPDMTFTVELVPELNITRDIPLVLQGVNKEEKYEGAFVDRPVTIWTFAFVMKGFLFGPRVDRKLIKFVNVSAHIGANAAEVNGVPAIMYSNTFPVLGNTDPLDIAITDDWVAVTEWHDRQANT